MGSRFERRSWLAVLLQMYSGGGSTSVRTPSLDWRLLADGAARFEDGTLPYLPIIGVRQARPAARALYLHCAVARCAALC